MVRQLAGHVQTEEDGYKRPSHDADFKAGAVRLIAGWCHARSEDDESMLDDDSDDDWVRSSLRWGRGRHSRSPTAKSALCGAHTPHREALKTERA